MKDHSLLKKTIIFQHIAKNTKVIGELLPGEREPIFKRSSSFFVPVSDFLNYA